MKPQVKLVALLTVVAVLLIVGYAFLRQREVNQRVQSINQTQSSIATQNLFQKRIILQNSHSLGGNEPVVVLTQFSDYECLACSAGWAISNKIVGDFSNDPRFAFVFRQSPQGVLHKYAKVAAQASESASMQGKFWEMHTMLFDKQGEWTKAPITYSTYDLFEQYANDIGIDGARLKSELKSGRFSRVVEDDRADAVKLGIIATPTFYINDEKYAGPLNYEDMKSAVQKALDASVSL